MTLLVVLAAGRGRRMGGAKALLAWTLLPQRWVLPLAAAHVERHAGPARVVVREEVAVALRRHARRSFTFDRRLVVSTADEQLGMAGSLRAAAESLAELPPRCLITPVDCPPANPATVAALGEALDAAPEAWAARPRHAGRRGHPVLLRAPALRRYVDDDAPPPLRDLLRSLGPRALEVDVPDGEVLVDLDDEAALTAWSERYGGGAIDEAAFFELAD